MIFPLCALHYPILNVEKLTDFIERIFQRESSLHLTCNDRNALFTSDQPKQISIFLYDSALKILSEYDLEIQQSQTADKPVTPRGRAKQPSQDQENKQSK